MRGTERIVDEDIPQRRQFFRKTRVILGLLLAESDVFQKHNIAVRERRCCLLYVLVHHAIRCGENHLFSATVCDWPERTDSGGWRVTVRLTEARGAKAVCYAKDEEMGGLEPGQALLGSAYWQDASEISSKELTTFTSRGVFALLYCEEMPSVTQGQAGSLRYLPQRLEKAFRENRCFTTSKRLRTC